MFHLAGNLDIKPLTRLEAHSVSSKDQGSPNSKAHFIFYDKEFSERQISLSVDLCISGI